MTYTFKYLGPKGLMNSIFLKNKLKKKKKFKAKKTFKFVAEMPINGSKIYQILGQPN